MADPTVRPPASGVDSFVVVKPDAEAAGLTGAISDYWRAFGYRVEDLGTRRLTRQDVFRLGTLSSRRAAPVKHEFNAQYLTSGPVRTLMIEGPDAIRAGVSLKTTFRQNVDASELFSLMHTPADDEEYSRQIAVLHDEPAGPEEEARELTEDEVASRCLLDRDTLGALVTEELRALPARRAAGEAGVVPAELDAAPYDQYFGIVIWDDTKHSVDDFAAIVREELPELRADWAVRVALRIKALLPVPVAVRRAPDAGRTWQELTNRHELRASLVRVTEQETAALRAVRVEGNDR
ncbi:nucleoside-diphosphate kinase [Streptomyces sp. NBC_01390]|uniref:hypothetical protein n=1 Tax=Streptomyces sp. NBC_01390 TaxID=2903850 RepID=UPI00324E1202